MCEACARSDVHPADHRMLMIKDPNITDEEDVEESGDESVVKEAEDVKVQVQGNDEPTHDFICDGCKMYPIVGARYKCLE